MKKLFLGVFLGLFFSCGDKDEPTLPNNENVKITELGNGIKKVDVIDLHATLGDDKEKGRYLKFNLAKASMTTGDDWDIAFYHRSIIVNGGEYVMAIPYNIEEEPKRTGNAALVIMGRTTSEDEAKPENLVIYAKETDGDYLKVKEVPKDVEFVQDKLNQFAIDYDSKGMFEYNLSPPELEHIVTIKKNRFLIIRTHDGHYAKLKIQSDYKESGKTAKESIDSGSMEAGLKYANYITFTYRYNTKKGDTRLDN